MRRVTFRLIATDVGVTGGSAQRDAGTREVLLRSVCGKRSADKSVPVDNEIVPRFILTAGSRE